MKVSVITVCRNEHGRVAETIKSVISQIYPDIEYIVIDGGSTDGTLKIINDFSSKITRIISEPDEGIYCAMNKGIGNSSGDYCMFINAGDRLCDVNILAQIFKKEPAEDILYGNVIKVYADRDVLEKKPMRMTAWRWRHINVCHQAALIKRELFIRHGAYDESYKIAADYAFFLRMIYRHRATMRYYNMPLAYYRASDGMSTGASNQRGLWLEKRRAEKNYMPWFWYIVLRAEDTLLFFLHPWVRIFRRISQWKFAR